MAIGLGSRIGPYEVTALLGEGGMGTVWRAHHSGLKRDDALKVLPDAFLSDPERLARFQREAQVLASLNHPNIAHVHGFERSDGVQALVMELVEGPTLADRIAQGPIPIDEALAIAKQIAEALEAAHEQGIVHRDLKPANIKVRLDGTVKVLDFGLAKALEPAGPMSPGMSQSPTITSPAMTQRGVILGTATYMSPEQARGKTVDRRTDIWAFGCVLYEMLTGKRAFTGEDVTDTLGAVIHKEVDWTQLPSSLSPSLAAYIKRCLQKDPKQRIDSAQAMRLALEGAFEIAAVRAGHEEAGVTRPQWRRALPWVAAIISAGVATGIGVWRVTRSGPSSPPAVSRFVITPAETAPLVSIPGRNVIISPDGRRIVYVGEDAKRGRMLFVRDLDALEARAVPGTETATDPFFSPDGAWIGFERGTVLMKVAASAGPLSEIVDAGAQILGSAWGADDTVIFAKVDGLYRVSAGGAAPSSG